MNLAKQIAAWIKKETEKADKNGIVIGLSGGVDSACVAALSKMALGKNVLALLLPCKSDPKDAEDARLVATKLKLRTKQVDLSELFDDMVKKYPGANALAKVNLKPRLRMMTLYYFANTFNYLVAGTGNKSEITIGYFTKYGDGGVDILPLGGLLKTEVRQLASSLKIPAQIIEKAPSAGLWRGQTDEEEMGISYEDLDKAIQALEKGDLRKIDKKILRKVKRMMAASEHKRSKPPVFKKSGGKK